MQSSCNVPCIYPLGSDYILQVLSRQLIASLSIRQEKLSKGKEEDIYSIMLRIINEGNELKSVSGHLSARLQSTSGLTKYFVHVVTKHIHVREGAVHQAPKTES